MTSVLGTKCDVPMPDERLEVSVTFDERHGYIGSAPELRSPVVALSLGGLRLEIAMLPDDLDVRLVLDRAARQERDRRRRGGAAPPQARPYSGLPAAGGQNAPVVLLQAKL